MNKRIAIPLIVPRFAAQFRVDRWVVLDRHTGHQTPARCEHTARERASLCNGVWRIVTWKDEAGCDLSA